MTPLLVWTLVVLATYRLAELISIDGITKPLRQAIGKKVTPDKKNFWAFFWWWLAEWINCPYCTGVWIAFVGTFLLPKSGVTAFVLYWLSIAGAQAFMEGITNREPE